MADTTALKNRIRAAIKANDNQEITGPVLQQTLLDIVDEIDLSPELENEAQQRQEKDTQLNNLITGIKNNVDNGYVYAGIATPSTIPVSGKVFYIALQAGTYTNFNNLDVTQGITFLKYNGTAWSLDVIVGIDNIPNANSSNLVKSGGVEKNFSYINLIGKGDNGSASSIHTNFEKGHIYRVWIDNPNISFDGVTLRPSGTATAKLYISSVDSVGSETDLIFEPMDNYNPLNDFYDIQIPNDSVGIKVIIRAAEGAWQMFYFQDMTDKMSMIIGRGNTIVRRRFYSSYIRGRNYRVYNKITEIDYTGIEYSTDNSLRYQIALIDNNGLRHEIIYIGFGTRTQINQYYDVVIPSNDIMAIEVSYRAANGFEQSISVMLNIENKIEYLEELLNVQQVSNIITINQMTYTNMYMSDNGTWKKSSMEIAACYIHLKAKNKVKIVAKDDSYAEFALVDRIGYIGESYPSFQRIIIEAGSQYNIEAENDCLLWVYNAEDLLTFVFPQNITISYPTIIGQESTINRYAVNLCNEIEMYDGILNENGGFVSDIGGKVTDFLRIDNDEAYCRTQYIHVCCSSFLQNNFSFSAVRFCVYDNSKEYIGKLDNISNYIDKEAVSNTNLFSNAFYFRVQFAAGTDNHYVALSNTTVLPSYTPYNKNLLNATSFMMFDKIRNTDGSIENMIRTALEYVNAGSVTNLGYGDSATAFDNIVEPVTCDPWNPDRYVGEKKQINCSAFVQLCLQGITFKNSRYVGGTNGINYGKNGYVFDANIESNYHNDPTLDGGRIIPCSNYQKLYANKILKYAYDRGFAYILEDGFKNVQVGDIIFSSTNSTGIFKGVVHCLFVSSVEMKSDFTKIIKIMEVSGSGNNLAHETEYTTKPLGWIYAARFPLPPVINDVKDIINNIQKFSFSSLSTNETFIIGTVGLSENIKAKGIYTAVIEVSSIGDFEIYIKSGNNILGSSGSNLYKRNDRITIKHFHLLYDSNINTNSVDIVIKAYSNLSSNVEIESVKFLNGYVTNY